MAVERKRIGKEFELGIGRILSLTNRGDQLALDQADFGRIEQWLRDSTRQDAPRRVKGGSRRAQADR